MTTSPVPSDTDRPAEALGEHELEWIRENAAEINSGDHGPAAAQAAEALLRVLAELDRRKASFTKELRELLRKHEAELKDLRHENEHHQRYRYTAEQNAHDTARENRELRAKLAEAEQARDEAIRVAGANAVAYDQTRAEVVSLQARLTAAEERLATVNAKSESLSAKLKDFLDGQSRIAQEIGKTTDKFEQQRLLGLAEARATLRSALDGDDDFMAPTIRACTGCGKCDYCAYPARALGLGEGDSDA